MGAFRAPVPRGDSSERSVYCWQKLICIKGKRQQERFGAWLRLCRFVTAHTYLDVRTEGATYFYLGEAGNDASGTSTGTRSLQLLEVWKIERT